MREWTERHIRELIKNEGAGGAGGVGKLKECVVSASHDPTNEYELSGIAYKIGYGSKEIETISLKLFNLTFDEVFAPLDPGNTFLYTGARIIGDRYKTQSALLRGKPFGALDPIEIPVMVQYSYSFPGIGTDNMSVIITADIFPTHATISWRPDSLDTYLIGVKGKESLTLTDYKLDLMNL